MYSKNDYRYYLENQLIHSDDFLAHYGVKGMKWKHHKNGLSTEIDNLKYDLRQRQVGEVRKGNTVYDPVKDTYTTADNRARRKKHSDETRLTTQYRDHLSGDYKIKRRTRKSKLFKAVGKITKAKDSSGVESRAISEAAQKKFKYHRTKNGVEEVTYKTDPRTIGRHKTEQQLKTKKTAQQVKTKKKDTINLGGGVSATFDEAKVKPKKRKKK